MGAGVGSSGVGGLILFESCIGAARVGDFSRSGAEWLREGAMGSGEREREGRRAACLGVYVRVGEGKSSPRFTSDSVSKSRESLSRLSTQSCCNIALSLESYTGLRE